MGNHNFKSVIKEGTVENVKEFLSHEPDEKNHVDRFGWTPCHWAIEYHKLDILQYLMEEQEADIRHIDNAGSNLLHHALHFAHDYFDIVKFLLESGKFKFDMAKDEHQNTTLHLAFKYCTLKEIAELSPYYKGLKDVFNQKNDHDLTPLAILRERCKNSPESLEIVAKLQEDIEKHNESPTNSKRSSSDEDSKKHSDEEGKKTPGSGILSRLHQLTHHHHDHHEEKEENKKHSDDEDEKHEKQGSKRHSSRKQSKSDLNDHSERKLSKSKDHSHDEEDDHHKHGSKKHSKTKLSDSSDSDHKKHSSSEEDKKRHKKHSSSDDDKKHGGSDEEEHKKHRKHSKHHDSEHKDDKHKSGEHKKKKKGSKKGKQQEGEA